MRRVVVAVALALSASTFAACGTPAAQTAKPVTAETVEARFKAAGLPVSKVIVYNATTDPNDLLGRPRGYNEKIDWVDGRVDKTEVLGTDRGGVERGGSLEVFATTRAAALRAAYLYDLQEKIPLFGNEYIYLQGPVVLRVSDHLTPSQANGYARTINATLYRP